MQNLIKPKSVISEIYDTFFYSTDADFLYKLRLRNCSSGCGKLELLLRSESIVNIVWCTGNQMIATNVGSESHSGGLYQIHNIQNSCNLKWCL